MSASWLGTPVKSTGTSASEQFLKKAIQVAWVTASRVEASIITRPEVPVLCLLPSCLGELVGILPLVAKTVVLLPVLLVRQDLVSLVYLLELGLGRLVSRVNIGVILACQPPEACFISFSLASRLTPNIS